MIHGRVFSKCLPSSSTKTVAVFTTQATKCLPIRGDETGRIILRILTLACVARVDNHAVNIAGLVHRHHLGRTGQHQEDTDRRRGDHQHGTKNLLGLPRCWITSSIRMLVAVVVGDYDRRRRHVQQCSLFTRGSTSRRRSGWSVLKGRRHSGHVVDVVDYSGMERKRFPLY